MRSDRAKRDAVSSWQACYPRVCFQRLCLLLTFSQFTENYQSGCRKWFSCKLCGILTSPERAVPCWLIVFSLSCGASFGMVAACAAPLFAMCQWPWYERLPVSGTTTEEESHVNQHVKVISTEPHTLGQNNNTRHACHTRHQAGRSSIA